MFRQTIIAAIKDSWDQSVPSPYGNEYSRGQFELAILLLGYGGLDDMEGAVLQLWAEAQAKGGFES